jgi:hypothetical protein
MEATMQQVHIKDEAKKQIIEVLKRPDFLEAVIIKSEGKPRALGFIGEAVATMKVDDFGRYKRVATMLLERDEVAENAKKSLRRRLELLEKNDPAKQFGTLLRNNHGAMAYASGD